MITFLKNNKKIIIGLLFLAFLYFLCSLFPYTLDDWAWGSSVGIERLETWFENYNGRYISNLIVLLLTRNIILRNIVMCATLFGIIYFAYRLTNKNNYTLFLLSAFLLLVIPRTILSQTIAFTSGFANYVISTVLIFIYFYFIKKEIKNKSKQIVLNLFLLILGFVSALFVEHVTIYIILITLIMIIYQFIKNKKISYRLIWYFIGAVVGAILMFSNGAYTNIANDEDFYRNVPTNGLYSILIKIQENFTTIYKETIFNNVVLNIFLLISLLILSYKFLQKNKDDLVKKKIVYFSIIFLIGYAMYSVTKIINPNWNIMLDNTPYFEMAISIIYFLTIFLIVFICIESKKVKQKILFYLLSIVILTLPLLIVQPISSRCFFTAYCMFILIVLELYNCCIEENKKKIILNQIVIVGILLYAIYFTSIYLYVFKIDQERIKYTVSESNNGAKTVQLVKLPYAEYLCHPNPTEKSMWEERFKLFYKIPVEVEIKNVSLEQWNKIKK